MKKIKDFSKFHFSIRAKTIIIGFLLLLALIIASCTGAITPSFSAMNQANMSMTDSDKNLALSDYLFLTDTTNVPVGEAILKRVWNVTAPGYSKTVLNETSPVFGPLNQKGSVFVNLTITVSSGYEYTTNDIFQVIDGTGWINADYSYKANYDSSSAEHPFGKIRFIDISIAKFYPEAKITDWWWKYSNKTGAISGNYSGVNSFILPMNSWTDTYAINLTVKNIQGDLVSIGKRTAVPPDNVHPLSDFTVTATAGVAPLNISIIDQSKSLANYTVVDIPLSYEYVVGNKTSPNVFGKVFNNKNVNVSLNSPGVYNISQKVTNPYLVSNQQKIEGIQVYSILPPDADFYALPQSGPSPLNVVFISLVSGTGPFSYEWYFGDKTAIVTDQYPTHVYTKDGLYNVTLMVTGAGGSTVVSKSSYINVSTTPPVANFTANVTTGFVPLAVQFSDLSIGAPASWNWTFGDGSYSDEQNPVNVYSTPGNFTVNLNVTNSAGSDTKTITDYINVTSPITTYTIIATAGNGGTISPSGRVVVEKGGDQTFLITPDSESGFVIRDVLVDGSSVGNVSNYTFKDVQEDKRIAAFFRQIKDSYAINASSDQYTIIYPHGISTNIPGSNKTYLTQAKPGDDLTSIMVDNNSYLPDTSWTFTDINSDNNISTLGRYTPGQVHALFNVNQTWGQVPLMVQFTDQSVGEPVSWYWQFGDGMISDVQSPGHTYQIPGIYSVTLRAANDHSIGVGYWRNAITVTEGIVPKPTPTPSPEEIKAAFSASPVNGSAPLNVAFQDLSTGNPVSWVWDFGDGQVSALQNPVHKYTEPGLYSVSLFAQNEFYSGSVIKPGYITVW